MLVPCHSTCQLAQTLHLAVVAWLAIHGSACCSIMCSFRDTLLPVHRFHQYSVGGPPEAVWQGDCIAGKGVGLACLDTPEGRVQVYDTHTCANYGHGYHHMDAEGRL